MTTVPGVFAGGDAQHGPRTVVEAIRSGKIAAASIDAWLRGAPPDATVGTPVRRADVPPLPVVALDRTRRARAAMPERSVEEILGEGNYIRIEEGLTDAMAQAEVRRCLRCDICIGCGLCMATCSEMGIDALRMAETRRAGSPTSTSRGRRSCASAAAPAPRSARPARSASRTATACGAPSSPAP